MIDVILFGTDGVVEPLTIEPTLAEFQRLVGGDIEAIGGSGWTAYLDEEGKYKPLRINLLATRLAGAAGWRGADFDLLLGPVVFLGPASSEGEDTSVTSVITDLIRDGF